MLKLIKPYGDCSSVGRAIGCGPIGRRFESDQSPDKFSGRSVVRLAHLVWDEGVAGSNPAAPTTSQFSIKIQYCFLANILKYLMEKNNEAYTPHFIVIYHIF